MSDNLKDRIARMRAWQAFETEDFRASDLEAVLSAAETLARQGKPQITEQMVEDAVFAMSPDLHRSVHDDERSTEYTTYWKCSCGQRLDGGRHVARAILEAALGKGGE